MPIETKYAKSNGVNIAYQVVGEGPIDLVFVMGWVSNIEYFWEEAHFARFLRRLASFSRLILFDKRGTGLSDRAVGVPGLEERMDDLRAVMDAVGSKRAALLGLSEAGALCTLFAATYPERTSALVLIGCVPRRLWAPDYPWGATTTDRARRLEEIERLWGSAEAAARDLERRAPSVAQDAWVQRWWATYLRQSASPQAAAAVIEMNNEIDVRPILPSIRVPTLILHRSADQTVNVEAGRYMAARIPGARYVELPGEDHLPFFGDQDAILEEVEQFLTGVRPAPEPRRVLLTLLSAEVVGPRASSAPLDDRAWRDLVDAYHLVARQELARFRGGEVEAGVGRFLAGFDGPARAINCACAIADAVRSLGLEVRAGLHTGECELLGPGVQGLAVHVAGQVMAYAAPGEIVVSNTVRDLVAGSGLRFEELAVQARPGIPSGWRLFRVPQAARPSIAMSPSSAASPSAVPFGEVARNNLPVQLTSFVGRERELGELKALLRSRRLVTVTGVNGSGKTRIALEAAAELVPEFPDGVSWVDLASLSDATLLPQAVMSALGLEEQPGRSVLETLCSFLGSRQLLLVLDNCEHLVVACGEVVEHLLRACPDVRFLATSREPLRIPGEVTWPIPPLSTPDLPLPTSAESLRRFEAAQLFEARAREVSSTFTLSDRNSQAVAAICHRLAGLPLALELAAAQVRVLSVEQIATRLDNALELLSGSTGRTLARHQTLWATLDWSYQLLSESEQRLFRRLAVFVGGFSLETAEEVVVAEDLRQPEVLDLLTGLVDKSLVLVQQGDREARYRLLEPVRQYAWQRLSEAGELDLLRSRHLAWSLRLVEQAVPQLRGPGQPAVLERLAAEHDNFRAALAWSQSPAGDRARGLRLSAALAWFWEIRGHMAEGRQWLSRTLAGAPGPPDARMRALCGAGWLADRQHDWAAVRGHLEQGLMIARELNDRWATAWALYLLGRVAHHEGDAAHASSLGKESLRVARAIGDRWLTAAALHLLALTAHGVGDYRAARARYEESIALRRELGEPQSLGISLGLFGLLAFQEKDYTAARALWHESLAILQRLGARWHVGNVLAMVAALPVALARPVETARLAGAVARINETSPGIPVPLIRPAFEEALRRSRQQLDGATFDAALAEGSSWPWHEAASRAQRLLGEELPPSDPPARRPIQDTSNPLTAREREVAILLAQGLTNRQISEALVIAESTAERHVANIFNKLGFHNRTQVAAWAVEHGLTAARRA